MNELTETNPFELTTFAAVEKMATYISESGMYGIRKPAQAVTLMMLAYEEKTTLAQLLRRIHVFDDGKISQRADYTQGEFQAAGNTIIFHVRTDEMVAATFAMGAADDETRARAISRFELLWELDGEEDGAKRSLLMVQIAKLSRDGEGTIIRTLADAEAKGITEGSKGMKSNWKTSPRQMLTARCVTEGIRLVDPARAAGLYSEDEVEDIRKSERQERQQPSTPKDRDREAMLAMIDQYHEEARNETHEPRRKELLGLASELKAKLADMDLAQTKPQIPNGETARIIDATDAVVEPPPQKESDPDQIPGLSATPWKDHIITTFKNKAYKGKKLGELSSAEIDVLHESIQKKIKLDFDPKLRFEAAQIALAFDAHHPEAQE